MIQEVSLSYRTISCPICEHYLIDKPNINCGFCNGERKINTIESQEDFEDRVKEYKVSRQIKIRNVANTSGADNKYMWKSLVNFLNNNL